MFEKILNEKKRMTDAGIPHNSIAMNYKALTELNDKLLEGDPMAHLTPKKRMPDRLIGKDIFGLIISRNEGVESFKIWFDGYVGVVAYE